MKILYYDKDGGSESKVWGFWLIEIKNLFSIVLLRFENGSREAYHNHAFNCLSWVLKGKLTEFILHSSKHKTYLPSWIPFVTRKSTFHQVQSSGRTWVLSFRGPWNDTWKEFVDKEITLTHGRKLVER